MTGQETRYDRIAEGYATHWSPVHRAATLRLLDEVATDAAPGDRRVLSDAATGEAVATDAGAGRRLLGDGTTGEASGRVRLLDVGCGTGALAVTAATRWPRLEVVGCDISAGMLAIAARTVAAAGEAAARIGLVRAPADRLPFGDGSFDLVLSAFVLQLVPSRPRALREFRRVLRPGGRLAYVGWLAGDLPFEADAAWDEALAAAGIERESSGGHDDLASPEVAARQLRAAGLSRVVAREDRLVHQFTPETYAAFVTQFDDGDLVLTLEPGARETLTADLLARLRRLPEDALRLELPIVYASGVRR